MKILVWIIVALLSLVISFNVFGQDLLTIEDAKMITLENNFGIQIAKNNIQIAQNQTDKKGNGYLPTVSANAGVNGNFGGSSQKFSSGMEAETSNAFTWGANASVRADYTLLDKRRDLTLDQLKETLMLTNLQLKQTIEQNLFLVYNSYYQVAQLSENVKALQEAINISNERLKRSQYELDLGQGSGLNVLNARVDAQRDSVNLFNALANLDTEKRNLNVAMGRNPSVEYNTNTSDDQTDLLELETIMESSKSENIILLLNQQNLAINEMDLQIIETEKKPILNVGASYDYNYSDNPAGAFINTSSSRGFAANIGLNWTIFDGSRDIRKQNTIINLSNQKLQLDQLQQEIERDILNVWANYQTALYILKVEKNAVKTNEENFIRTEEQLNIGRLSSIEFRQAQLNLLNAQTSLSNAKLTAKLREIQLLQLGGLLID